MANAGRRRARRANEENILSTIWDEGMLGKACENSKVRCRRDGKQRPVLILCRSESKLRNGVKVLSDQHGLLLRRMEKRASSE
jgi:hypothetical protein